MVAERFAVGHLHFHFQIVGRLGGMSEEQHARGREFHPVRSALLQSLLQGDAEIVFDHSYDHAGVVSALAFQVVDHIFDAEDGIGDAGAQRSFVLLVELHDRRIYLIAASKHLVDEGDQKLRCLVHHGLEDRVIDIAAVHGQPLLSRDLSVQRRTCLRAGRSVAKK